MRIVVVGTRRLSLTLLQHLHGSWNVVGAVGGTGTLSSQAGYGSFAELASQAEYDFDVLETDDINSDRVAEWLRDLDPDLCICAGWTQIIDESVLSIPTHGFVGLHASHLPEGRGGAPVNWRIIQGADDVGLTLFFFTPAVDEGDILEQTTVPIEGRDDVGTVYDRITLAACNLIDAALPALETGSAERRPQRMEEATYRPQRKPDDGLVEWERDADALSDWVRALTYPYPGAFTFFDGERLILWEAESTGRRAPDSNPGEVIEIRDGRGLDVATGDGILTVARAEIGHGPPQWADELASRGGIVEGTQLGTPDDFPEWLYTGIRGPDGRYDFETNIATGAEGTVQAVACSHSRPRTITVTAEFDKRQLLERTVTVDGWARLAVTYMPTDPAPHSLRIRFEEDGEGIDSRYLKIFAR